MKILHTADWHLGAYVGPQCDDSMKKMENAIHCLDVLVETARQEQPDIILIAGDIFHTAKVWADRALTEVRVAEKYINQLKQYAPVVVLYGTPNHDGAGQFETLKSMTEGREKYKYSVTFFNTPEVKTIQTNNGDIQVAGLPGFDKGTFRAQHPGLSAEEENVVFTEELDKIVQGLSAQIDLELPSLLIAHHTVVGCTMDNGQHVFQANEVVLKSETLDNSNFDMVLLGHIHKAQKVAECSKPVYYSGSIDAFTFNDEGHSKGFFIHETKPNNKYHQFIKTPARQFYTITADGEMLKDIMENGLFFDEGPSDITGNVIRVLYSCDKATEKALDKKKLERDLYAAGAYYVSEIRPEKVIAEVNREKMHEKLTVWDCLRRYLREKFKTESFADILMEAEPIVSEVEASEVAGTQSGIFLPLEIELRNYRSYAEEKLNFTDLFFCMLNGRNGSGKSSLVMDSIVDCLYEEPREGELTGWIKSGEKSGSISFTFQLGVGTYRVTRTRQRSGKATLSISELPTLGEGIKYNSDFPLNWEDISCQKLVDTQQKIVQLLGMDVNTFRSCVLIMQDQYGRFMEAKSEDRMSVLASLLGLGVYEQLEEKTKKLLQDVNRELKSKKDNAAAIEFELSAYETLKNDKASIEGTLKTETAALKLLKDDYQVTSDKVALYKSNKQKLDEAILELSKKERAHADKANKIMALRADILETKGFLSNEALYNEKHAELVEVEIQITTMDGTAKLLEDKKKALSKVNSDIVMTNINIDKYKKELRDIENSLSQYQVLSDELSALNGCDEDVRIQDGNKAKHDAIVLQILDTTGNLSKFESNIRIYEQQSQILKNSNCIDIVQAQCGFLRNAKESEVKLQELLKNKLDLQNYLVVLEDSKRELGYSAEYHKEIINKCDRAKRLTNKLATMESERKSAEIYEKQIVELNTRLDSLVQDKVCIESDIASIAPKVSMLPELQKLAEELKEYKKLVTDISKAKTYLETVEPQLTDIESELSEIDREIINLKSKIASLQFEVSDNSKFICSLQVISGQIAEFETNISTYNRLLGSIDEKISALEHKAEVLNEMKVIINTLAAKASCLQILSEAFSQDGIPHQIVRDIVPELEESANEILSKMTGGRMSLEFKTERTLKSNKDKEVPVLDVMITDIDNGELPYLSRSGGQKTRCSLSVIFALAILKASRMGLQLGMLFIDEPAGLDEEGIDGYCSALETIHNLYPEMRIVAISHDERMKARFSQHLFVEVTENGSKVRKS